MGRGSDPTSLWGALLEELPLGVIVLDRDGRVVLYNKAEAELAQRQRQDVVGRDFFEEVAPCMRVSALADAFRANIGHRPIARTVQVSFARPFHAAPRDVVVRLRSQAIDDEPFGVLYLEEIGTELTAARAREALTQLVVHDMKGPLAAIMANLDFVDETPLEPDARTAIGDSKEAALRLRRMLGNVLEIARLQTGTLTVARSDGDGAALLAAVARASRGIARKRGVEVVVDPGVQSLPAQFDPEILRRALDNLVDNAVRHSPKGSTVRLLGKIDEGMLVLEVADEGPGIAEDLRERVFDAYTRITHEELAGDFNQGLGLTFVRLAAFAHGGTASLQSARRRGAVFRIAVPV